MIEAVTRARVAIGPNNVFWPGTVLYAAAGEIVIGAGNAFGSGGATVRLEEARIRIGSFGRYRDEATILAGCDLGDVERVLGPVQAQDCVLGGGGSHAEPDPDARGGVHKGVGRARGQRVRRGEVILGEGRFDAREIKPQSHYPPPKRA